nr:MAG TPA: hypothetical protein [Crassvirales sp.]
MSKLNASILFFSLILHYFSKLFFSTKVQKHICVILSLIFSLSPNKRSS